MTCSMHSMFSEETTEKVCRSSGSKNRELKYVRFLSQGKQATGSELYSYLFCRLGMQNVHFWLPSVTQKQGFNAEAVHCHVRKHS